MSIHPHTPRVAASTQASGSPAPSLVEHGSYEPPAIDPHGFDASEYDWVPVKRKPRADGWSGEKQRAFIGHLADEGSVATAARLVGMSTQSCYRLRRTPGAENFARAWDAAIGEAGKRLLDVAFERATIGAEEPVFDRDGQVVAVRNRPSDRMLIFLLRTRFGDRLGLAPARDAAACQASTADAAHGVLPSVAQAMIALQPAGPPHLAMTPDDLAHKVRIAAMGDEADGEADAASASPFVTFDPDAPPPAHSTPSPS